MYMGSRRRVLTLYAIGALLALVAVAKICLFVFDPYRREMRPVHAVIAAGEMGWASEATDLLDRVIARSADKHALADRLLQESDGSLVAEGMILAVRSRHPRVRSLLEAHLSDHRWNWYLGNNDELARELLCYLDGRPIEGWVVSLIERKGGD